MRREQPASRLLLPRLGAFAFLGGLLAFAGGCAGGVGDVSGKITYKGQPVVYGSVGFVGADGIPRSARINPDGTYSVRDVAVGDAKVTVSSEKPNQQSAAGGGGRGRREPEVSPDHAKDLPKRGGSGDPRADIPDVVDPEVAKKWFAIPGEFADLAKTKLKFTVRKGSNTYDIQLD